MCINSNLETSGDSQFKSGMTARNVNATNRIGGNTLEIALSVLLVLVIAKGLLLLSIFVSLYSDLPISKVLPPILLQ
jgi:ABC-type lipoprotein release transport system permease subunit